MAYIDHQFIGMNDGRIDVQAIADEGIRWSASIGYVHIVPQPFLMLMLSNFAESNTSLGPLAGHMHIMSVDLDTA